MLVIWLLGNSQPVCIFQFVGADLKISELRTLALLQMSVGRSDWVRGLFCILVSHLGRELETGIYQTSLHPCLLLLSLNIIISADQVFLLLSSCGRTRAAVSSWAYMLCLLSHSCINSKPKFWACRKKLAQLGTDIHPWSSQLWLSIQSHGSNVAVRTYADGWGLWSYITFL